MARKRVAAICLIITQLLVRMGWKTHVKLTQHCRQSYKKKFFEIYENIDFLIYFSSKGRHVTHEVQVDHRPYAKIGHLDSWKECSNNLLNTNSTIKVRMGSKTHVKLIQHCRQSYKKKIFKI